jgi:hypothetical protein
MQAFVNGKGYRTRSLPFIPFVGSTLRTLTLSTEHTMHLSTLLDALSHAIYLQETVLSSERRKTAYI